MKKRNVILLSILSLFLAFLIFISATAIDIWNYGKVDEKQSADAAIVLGAALDYNTVSPVYRERINHAINLYNDGYVKYVILTGGIGEGNIYSDAFIAMEYAVSKGLPKSAILLEEMSTITEENIVFSKDIMDNNHLKTAIIVSDPIHMKRAMSMAKDYGLTAYSSPTPTTMYKTAKTKFPFLMRELILYVGYGLTRIFK